MTIRATIRALAGLLAVAACCVPAAALADGPSPGSGRVFEIVTPPDKNGGAVGNKVDRPQAKATADGHRLLTLLQPAALDDAGANLGLGQQVLIERRSDGWHPRSLTPRFPPGTDLAPQAQSMPVVAWTPDMSQLLYDTTYPLDSVHDKDQAFADMDLYLEKSPGVFELVSCAKGEVCTQPNVASSHGPIVTADLSHIYFMSDDGLVDGAPAGKTAYDRMGDRLRLVTPGPPLFGGEPAIGATSVLDISEDGSHVLLYDESATAIPQIYLQIDGDKGPGVEKTIQVTRTHTANPSGGTFMGATPDGNTVLFFSRNALTADDHNTVADLYAWHYDPVAGTESLQMVAALPQVGGQAGDPSAYNAGPNGGVSPADSDFANVVAMSTDPTKPLRVYFTAGRANGSDIALYLATDPAAPTGNVRFIAKVANGTSFIFGCLGTTRKVSWIADQGTMCAHTTPDGRLLAFDSRLPMTNDDRDTAGANTCSPASITGTSTPSYCKFDSYLYDADAPEADSLTRLSIGADGPDGARGNGAFDSSQRGSAATSNAPASVITSDGKRVFFHSGEALVPQDENDVQDVYEYRTDLDQVFLVSGGREDSLADAFYFDESDDGRDVFFSTTDGLVPEDTDDGYDIYDARVGGGFPRPAPCNPLDGRCRGPAAFQPPGPAALDTIAQRPAGAAGNTARAVMWVPRISATAASRLARTGKVTVPIGVSAPGKVVITGRAPIGKRILTAATGSRTAKAAGAVNVTLRLTKLARRELARKRRLRLSLSITHTKVPSPKKLTLTLKRPRTASAR